MNQKKIRGINLIYEDIGAGNPLVFVHGHPFNRSMWKYQTDFFKEEYRLIIPDLRGYGETKISSDCIMLDDIALDIAYLLDELNIPKAIFCGLSMGGQIILDFYRLFPNRVNALIIADSDPRGETEETFQNRLALAERILKIGMKNYTEEDIHKYICEYTMENFPEKVDHLYHMMTTTNKESAAAVHKGRAERRDHLGILKNIYIPTLIVVGSHDFFTPVSTAELMSSSIPGSELAIISDSGHIPNLEQPEAFNKHVKNFLVKYNL